MMRRNAWTAALAVGLMLTGSFGYAEESVYFATGSAALSPKSKASLKHMAAQVGSGAIKLHGSTDPRGSDEVNARLREERVRSVREFLVRTGVSEAQIQSDTSAMGEGNPSTYWKLRRVAIDTEGGAVANSKPEKSEKAEPPAHMTKAEKRKAALEAKRAEAEQKKADALAKKAAAAEAKQAAADAKRNEKLAALEPKNTEKPVEAKTEVKAETKTEKPTEVAQTNKKNLEPLKLIYWKSLNHALWIIAKEKGFFAEEGFDVQLKETTEDARVVAKSVGEISTGVQSTKALDSGQKTFAAGAVCGFAVHEAMAKKDQVIDIGSMIMIPLVFVVTPDTAKAIEKDLHAFKGLKIGECTYGAGEHEFKYTNVLRSELAKIGLKEKVDYSITEYKDSGYLNRAYEKKEIDVAIMIAPDDVEFIHTHKDNVRLPFARFFPYLPCCRQLITRSQLKNSRDKYVRMLRASILAHEFIIKNPRESSQILSSYLKVPADVIRQSIMTSYVQLTPDPMRKGIELFQRTNDKYTGTKTNTAEYVDTSLYRDALYGLADDAKADPSRKGYYDTMVSRFRANN